MNDPSIQECCVPHNLKKENVKRKVPWPLERLNRYSSLSYWKENYLVAGYLILILLINIVMAIIKICQMKEFKNLDGSSPNFYYMFARATGMYRFYNYFHIDIERVDMYLM